MSKKMSYLLGIALTIILGTFLYQKFCCDCCADVPKDETAVAPSGVDTDSITTVPTEKKLVVDSSSVSTTDWVALKEKFNADPLILYFNTAQSGEELTDEEKIKVNDLVNYSKNVPAAAINSIGHTDNVGTAESNQILGQNRAEFVKDYLTKKGVNGTKITTSSKGQSKPVADNTTEEGRSKNRRTVITIQ